MEKPNRLGQRLCDQRFERCAWARDEQSMGVPGLRLVTRQKDLLQRALSCKELLNNPHLLENYSISVGSGVKSIFCNFCMLT